MTGLRVLLVTDAVGGVWIYSLELARALKPLGIEAILAVTGPTPRRDQREAAAGVRLIETGLPLEWLETNPRELAEAAESLARIAAAERIDVVQTSSAAMIAGGRFDCPCIAVQHSCVATWWSAVKATRLASEFEWRRQLVEQGLRRAEAIVAPSRAFAEATERAYALDCRILAVHNGRTPRQLRELPPGNFVFTAGRLWDEGKNAATLDRAAARIAAPFQAAGPTHGPNGADVRLNGLLALGELSESKLGAVFAARPIYASAAFYEPFGLSVLEAAQAGCALVLSDIPTHRELWEGAATFVDARDESAYAAAINELLGDRGKRDRLGQQAREQARQYTPDRMARGMVEIYARVTQPQLVAGAA